MRFYGDDSRLDAGLLRARLVAGAILVSGVLWSLEGFLAGHDRAFELLLAVGLAHLVWLRFGRRRPAGDDLRDLDDLEVTS